MHCHYVSVSYVEQGPEETPEPAPVEGVNLEQDQGKPWYI
jgi:hypothetical protein